MDIRNDHIPEQPPAPGTNDNSSAARASFAAVSLLCMLVMATLLGSRINSIFDRKYWSTMTTIRLMPYFLYSFGIAFNIASSVVVANLGLHQASDWQCKAAMHVCLVFYCGTKICVQAFLIERAHAVRHKLKKRLDDWIWITFVVVTICGFGVIIVLAMMGPHGAVNAGDQQCRIGLPRRAVMTLMTWDILFSVSVTAVFIGLLVPLLRKPKSAHGPVTVLPASSPVPLTPILRAQESESKVTAQAEDSTHGVIDGSETSFAPHSLMGTMLFTADRNTDHLKALVIKSVFGTTVMVAATIVNLVLLYNYNGYEHGWLCFMCCLVDVTWTILVIHFLTETKREAIGPILARQAYSNERMQTMIRRPTITTSGRSWSEGGSSVISGLA